MEPNKYITVPILDNFFDHNKVVGELSIRADALPPTHDFVFAIGARIPPSDTMEYELLCVSIVPNVDEYLGYLLIG